MVLTILFNLHSQPFDGVAAHEFGAGIRPHLQLFNAMGVVAWIVGAIHHLICKVMLEPGGPPLAGKDMAEEYFRRIHGNNSRVGVNVGVF